MSSLAPATGSRRSMLATYTKPVRWPLALLGLILAATIAVQLITPILTARFIDRAIGGAPMDELVSIAVLAAVIAIAGYLLTPIETWASEHIAWEATNALRADLLAHLFALDATFHARHTAGSLIERIDGDVSHRRAALARADRVVVLEAGRVVAQDPVPELLATSDAFRRLWEMEIPE